MPKRQSKLLSIFTILTLLMPHASYAKVYKDVNITKVQAMLAEPIQLRCNMGACSWANIQTIKRLGNNQGTDELHEISYIYGSSNHVKEPNYPVSYSPNLPIKWEKNLSKIMVYCSPIKPAVFGSKSSIETFEFPLWFGYEISAIKLYMYTCHDLVFTGNNEIFNDLVYSGIQRKKFDNIEGLLN